MFTLLQTSVLVGLDWVEPMMLLLLHITCSCIFMHTFFTFFIFLYIELYWDFSDCLFLPLSLLLSVSCVMAPNENLLRLGTLFISGHPLLLTPLPLTSGSMMKRPNQTFFRTSPDKAFIRNAKSFFRTSPTLTYPMSSTIGVGSHYVTSQSCVC